MLLSRLLIYWTQDAWIGTEEKMKHFLVQQPKLSVRAMGCVWWKLEPGTRKSCPHKPFYNFQHAQKCFIYVRNWWEILPNHFRCKCCVHHSSEQRWFTFSFLDSNGKKPNKTSMTIWSVLTAEHIAGLSFYFFISLVYLKETDINFLHSRVCYGLEPLSL